MVSQQDPTFIYTRCAASFRWAFDRVRIAAMVLIRGYLVTKRKSDIAHPSASQDSHTELDEALDALLRGGPKVAAVRFAQRLLVNPRDDISLSNQCRGAYDAPRWADAARRLSTKWLARGIEFQVAVPMLFSLVYCRLELDDSRRALEGDERRSSQTLSVAYRECMPRVKA